MCFVLIYFNVKDYINLHNLKLIKIHRYISNQQTITKYCFNSTNVVIFFILLRFRIYLGVNYANKIANCKQNIICAIIGRT